MRNRAKCRLCKDILESFKENDMVECSCKEIAIDGGPDKYLAYAKDFKNFLRIDENDKEIEVTVKEVIQDSHPVHEITQKERMALLDERIRDYENLSDAFMSAPVSHYDLYSVLLLVRELLKHLPVQ